MDVELRCIHNSMDVRGSLRDDVALALQKDDEVVFPFIGGCWVIKKRHLVVHHHPGAAIRRLPKSCA